MKHIKKLSEILSVSILFFVTIPVSAAGTSAKGWVVVQKVNKLESSGVMFNSWEGTLTIVSYDKAEKCSDKAGECFTPTAMTIPFSIRKDNSEAVKGINKFMDGGSFLIHYRRHRFEPMKLSSKLEILEVKSRSGSLPSGIPRQKTVKKTGSRNFSIKGGILQLDRQGFFSRTYEGLYRDGRNEKVHPFSVTDKGMAAHIYRVMETNGEYNIGISDAIVKGTRKSDLDIYEINFDKSALGFSPEAEKSTTHKEISTEDSGKTEVKKDDSKQEINQPAASDEKK